MADSGFNWEDTFSAVGVEGVTLTTAGTDEETSDEIDMDNKAACQLAIDVDYSDHEKLTGGLMVYIFQPVNDVVDYQGFDDQVMSFEMDFEQDGTVRTSVPISGASYDKVKVGFKWLNATSLSNCTITLKTKFATIPPAS